MAEEDLVELKFRLADGTDIGPTNCRPSTSVGSLKERIVAQWPKDKENAPKTVNDVKLINAGKILENNKTLAESRLPIGELPGGVITMHVVVRPPISDNEKLKDDLPKKNRCLCTIL
ncbi:membrane-anchored ubiquitin-fold protein 6 [Rhododendron vialii]|uniref:membrane-anchored ubiquitin-fold protein 6 n=1 Tax=Rhododendron vialii TaxID=182163 RepID=UPI00265FA4B4|nr:membrane-anchored ubiquitin-fold protein 6 [Rhododendron vialii]